MGKKSRSPFKDKKKKSSKDYKDFYSRSPDHSGDFRLTPEYLLRDVHQCCNGTECCSRRRSCPQGDICCSRETCLLTERRYRKKVSSASPSRGRVSNLPSCECQNPKGQRHLKKDDMEVIIYNDKKLTVRKKAPYCSTCDSCDSCMSGDSSYTHIDMTNDLFTTPLETTQASFYADIIPERQPRIRQRSPSNHRSMSPDRQRRRSRRRREHSFEENVIPCDKKKENNTRNQQYSTGRDHPTSELPSVTRESPSGNGSRSPSSRGEVEPPGGRSRNRNSDRKTGDRSRPMKSPNRSHARTNDSGMGKSYRTSGSSGFGVSIRSGDGGRGSRTRDELREKESSSQGQEESQSRIKQANLINKMVNQTREHRKQIKTLESELERLRSSGDALSNCEVSQNAVEWRPGDVVGEGSFSTVYKGSYCGTDVAVKELKFKLSQDDKNYFRSEAALLQQLHHPRVVLLMGVCTTATRPFMLLEFLSGGTLHTLIHSKTRERLDHAAYFAIAKDVAQGLNYLHKHDPQVLHLDLKSMNVLLDGYSRAKIADFGFSILRRSRGAGGGSAVQRGSIRGTPAWMSPELLTKGEVSPKCDVYSYAIILWEMLTASHPFQGLDIYRIMEAVEDGVRPPLPKSGVSSELRELITSCWAQNPSLRPSFEEILGALETASLPSSWRKLLSKANIAPGTLADLKTAKALISMIQRSVEMHERSNKGQSPRRSRSDDETEVEVPQEKSSKNRNSKNYAIQDPVVASSNHGRRSSSRGKKLRQNQSHSSRDTRRDFSNEHKSSNSDRRDTKSPSKRIRNHAGSSSPRRDAYDSEKHKEISPKRRNKHKENSDYRDSKEKRIIKPFAQKQNDNYKERVSRSYNRSPTRGRFQRHDSNCKESSRKSDKSYSQRSKQKRRESITLSDSHYSDSESSFKENRKRCASQTDTDLSNSSSESLSNSSGNSLDEIERKIPTRRSFTRSEKPLQRRRSQTSSPTRRMRAASPKKRSPTRKSYTPEKTPVDHKPRESSIPQKYVGMVLTAEQLLSQKKRLRPVRSTALKDLSMIPQSSFNDISLLLQQAILQRRDALNQIPSHRGTSKDLDWSDYL
ncbi:UNVERIFIED_CONTAM: hypothetical protein RMT77_003927 [Armadillidium vulgare]